jgi:hypothetical protein
MEKQATAGLVATGSIKQLMCHCEERSDEAISTACNERDCFASLAMTVRGFIKQLRAAINSDRSCKVQPKVEGLKIHSHSCILNSHC